MTTYSIIFYNVMRESQKKKEKGKKKMVIGATQQLLHIVEK